MVGIGGSHSKPPSTSSLQHAAQHSHPPQRSGQPSESPQFSTSLPSPIRGGGCASNSSFSPPRTRKSSWSLNTEEPLLRGNPQPRNQSSQISNFNKLGGGGRSFRTSSFLQRSLQPRRQQRPTSIQTSLPLRDLRGPKNHSRTLDPNGVSPLTSPIDTTQFDADSLGLLPTSAKRLPQQLFSAQSQQHSKHPSRLPKLSLNTKVSSLQRPSTKPLLVSSPSHTQTLRDSKHSPPTNGSNLPQPDPSPAEGRCSCGSDLGMNPDCGLCWAHRRIFEQLSQSRSVTASQAPTCSLCGTDVDIMKGKNRCRRCYHKYESPADFLFGRAHATSGKK
jgi:hypothetical protein